MKFVKFGIFALSMGLFVASCGSSETTEETTDSTMMVEPMEPVAPVDTMTAAPVDTTMVDTTAAPAM